MTNTSDDGRDFPPEFLWGSSTAAHQVEGGNTNNDWWDWEHDPASPCVESSGDAIDQLHRYDDDFALLAAVGQNAHRLSIEWSRVEPAEGEFSEAALDHYERVLSSVAGHGLTALVTLYHFTLPRWFVQRGGWLAADGVEIFARFVRRVSERLGPLMPYACTINEPQVVASIGHLIGLHPPGHHDMNEALEVNRALMRAHRAATAVLRETTPETQVGTCLQLPYIVPADDSDEAKQIAELARAELQESHIDDLLAGGDVGDFVGLQYYTRMRMDPSQTELEQLPPEGVETTLMGWEVFPEGLRHQLHAIARAGLPVIVTENGIATADDEQRVRYLQTHLAAVRQAMDEGVDVRGYVYWSSFDNFEWTYGRRPTFGLIGIDYDADLRRVVRPSAVAYGELARTGRLAALIPGK